MGRLSIWHWLIVILIFALPVWLCFRSAKKHPQEGIAGWLLFFIYTLGLTILYNWLQIQAGGILPFKQALLMTPHPPPWLGELISQSEWLLYGYVIVRFSALFILLSFRQRATVYWAIGLLWASTLISNASYLLPIYVLEQQSAGSTSPNIWFIYMIGTTTPRFVFALIWSIYLLKSRRVKRTYPVKPGADQPPDPPPLGATP